MCDLDLSISKEVFKARGKNDFRTKNSGVLKGKNIKREVTTSLFNNDKNIALNESVTSV